MVFFLRVIAQSPQVLSNDALYCRTVNFGRRIQRARRTIGLKNTRVKKKESRMRRHCPLRTASENGNLKLEQQVLEDLENVQ